MILFANFVSGRMCVRTHVCRHRLGQLFEISLPFIFRQMSCDAWHATEIQSNPFLVLPPIKYNLILLQQQKVCSKPLALPNTDDFTELYLCILSIDKLCRNTIIWLLLSRQMRAECTRMTELPSVPSKRGG